MLICWFLWCVLLALKTDSLENKNLLTAWIHISLLCCILDFLLAHHAHCVLLDAFSLIFVLVWIWGYCYFPSYKVGVGAEYILLNTFSLQIFLYGGYSKEVSSDKSISEKGNVHSDMWSLDPRTWEWNKVNFFSLSFSPIEQSFPVQLLSLLLFFISNRCLTSLPLKRLHLVIVNLLFWVKVCCGLWLSW